MKKNKGFTLVELLVAVAVLLLVMAEVGALMVNSQTLYRNGYYEVNLQENAQQIVTQVQDILMNTQWIDNDLSNPEVSITTSGACGINSDVIKIRTRERVYNGDGNPTGWTGEVQYQIGRAVDLGIESTMSGTTGKEYTKLYLVKGTTKVPIADGVRSMHVETLHFNTGDVVTLDLEMQNRQYSYSTSSEVYLRNQPGTGGPTVPPASTTSGADVDLTVLRVHEYNLWDYVPSTYKNVCVFKFKDDEASTLSSMYTLTDNVLTCSSLNNNWDDTCTGTILASKDGSYSDALTISIHTDAVNDGYRYPLYEYVGQTAKCMNAIPVTGICTCEECCELEHVTMDGQISLPFGGTDMDTTFDHTRDDGATETKGPVDLLLFKGSNSNFVIRSHADDAEHERGYPYVSDHNVIGPWSNEVFQRVSGNEDLDFNLYFEFKGYKVKDPSKTEWDGKNPITHNEYLAENYTEVSDCQKKWPSTNPSAGKFTLSSIHPAGGYSTATNGFMLNTSYHATGAPGYWGNIVDKGGYIRAHIWYTYGSYGTLDLYTYLFPQGAGSTGQHNKLTDIITAPVPADEKNVTDYQEYYTHGQEIEATTGWPPEP